MQSKHETINTAAKSLVQHENGIYASLGYAFVFKVRLCMQPSKTCIKFSDKMSKSRFREKRTIKKLLTKISMVFYKVQ